MEPECQAFHYCNVWLTEMSRSLDPECPASHTLNIQLPELKHLAPQSWYIMYTGTGLSSSQAQGFSWCLIFCRLCHTNKHSNDVVCKMLHLLTVFLIHSSACSYLQPSADIMHRPSHTQYGIGFADTRSVHLHLVLLQTLAKKIKAHNCLEQLCTL